MDKPAGTGTSVADLSQGRVGIVTNSFDSAFYSQMVVSASNYLLVRGFQAIVESNLEREELAAITVATQKNYDGLIVHADLLSDDQVNQFMQRHENVVMLNRRLPLYPDRCLYVDNVLGGSLAARALISQGHVCIAMVCGPEGYLEADDRSEGFKREMAKHKLQLCAELKGDFEKVSGEHAMEEIHKNNPDITAVFFQNDEMAFGALSACRRLGLNVPDDVSIIGFDGLPMCEYMSPSLTSVQQPLAELGEHAARMICDLIQNIDPSQRTTGSSYLPVLVERESVARPAGYTTGKISLTQREQECLTWTANGKTSWEISVILGVSESTATFHLRNAVSKLKASNRAHAVAKATSLGLIDVQLDKPN